eukprot:7071034-Alexandrium_andersonii.AAC.1
MVDHHHQSVQVAAALLQARADPSGPRTPSGANAPLVAAGCGNKELLELLFLYGANFKAAC